jgi:hypothetical protein
MEYPNVGIIGVYFIAAVLLVIVPVLIKPIIWPVIITHPWKGIEKEDRVVILAGSYNPPHHGHLAMLEYLSTR